MRCGRHPLPWEGSRAEAALRLARGLKLAARGGAALPAPAAAAHPRLRLHDRGEELRSSRRPATRSQWFAVAWERQDIWRRALAVSVRVAAISTLLALVLGTLAAAAVARSRFFGREAISLLLILPIALPGIITGISLRSAFALADIPFSFWTIVLGHATFCIVVVYNNAVARLRRTSGSLIEASMDLGADGFQTFRYVLLPNLATALLAGGMLAFALSFDEVIVTTFTAGQQTTLPIWMLSELIRPRQRPGHQCRRRVRHRRHVPADPRRLLPDARGRERGRPGEVMARSPSPVLSSPDWPKAKSGTRDHRRRWRSLTNP